MDLLPARELELGPAQRLHHVLLVLRLGADGHNHLPDVHPRHRALRLPKRTPHPYNDSHFSFKCAAWPLRWCQVVLPVAQLRRVEVLIQKRAVGDLRR